MHLQELSPKFIRQLNEHFSFYEVGFLHCARRCKGNHTAGCFCHAFIIENHCDIFLFYPAYGRGKKVFLRVIFLRRKERLIATITTTSNTNMGSSAMMASYKETAPTIILYRYSNSVCFATLAMSFLSTLYATFSSLFFLHKKRDRQKAVPLTQIESALTAYKGRTLLAHGPF